LLLMPTWCMPSMPVQLETMLTQSKLHPMPENVEFNLTPPLDCHLWCCMIKKDAYSI
jgi:hypothetical protein